MSDLTGARGESGSCFSLCLGCGGVQQRWFVLHITDGLGVATTAVQAFLCCADAMRTILLRRLGSMEYGKCLALQMDLLARRVAGEVPDTLLLVEHPSVFTIGKRDTQVWGV